MKTKLTIAVILIMVLACNNTPIPKPTGYYRIDLPEKEYKQIDSIPFPFQFELPQYAHVNLERTAKEPNFFNIDFTRFKARLHLSYVPVQNNLPKLLEDARTLVYKHVSKAQDIRENLVLNEGNRVFGTYYEIAGNTASGSQFYLTDSSQHFLRGALYFNAKPNFDSIAPVQKFLDKDLERLIESLAWTK